MLLKLKGWDSHPGTVNPTRTLWRNVCCQGSLYFLPARSWKASMSSEFDQELSRPIFGRICAWQCQPDGETTALESQAFATDVVVACQAWLHIASIATDK